LIIHQRTYIASWPRSYEIPCHVEFRCSHLNVTISIQIINLLDHQSHNQCFENRTGERTRKVIEWMGCGWTGMWKLCQKYIYCIKLTAISSIHKIKGAASSPDSGLADPYDPSIFLTIWTVQCIQKVFSRAASAKTCLDQAVPGIFFFFEDFPREPLKTPFQHIGWFGFPKNNFESEKITFFLRSGRSLLENLPKIKCIKMDWNVHIWYISYLKWKKKKLSSVGILVQSHIGR
jgi:hypothetical protein